MTNFEYDKKSASSIYEFSMRLFGKSLSEVIELPIEVLNKKNKGNLGRLIEKYFFKINPGNWQEPDFADAGLELKVTGVVRDKTGKFRAKERLVLTMINYEKILNESFESSSFIHKCKNMLILFYLYESDKSVANRKFVLMPMLYEIPKSDFVVIKKDWEFIRSKIAAKKAHELSEGDTFYLGACRKGAGGVDEALRSYSGAEIKAKGRAFAFKQGYMNQLVTRQVLAPTLEIDESTDFELATMSRFDSYKGMKVAEIAKLFDVQKKGKNDKGFKRKVAMLMLCNGKNRAPELEKAGIKMKIITLNSSGKSKESMSFPSFDFIGILDEEWEQSSFCDNLESKFLFVIFRAAKDGSEYFEKAAYWNMPFEDREEAKRVWQETKRRVKIDASKLPKISESNIAHVRPKGKDGADTAMTPQGNLHLKQCFWLNRSYISKIANNLLVS